MEKNFCEKHQMFEKNCQYWKITGLLDSCIFTLRKEVKDKSALLSLREQKILEMRLGVIDGVTHTLEEVAKEFGITRERIRQIEAKALEKINHSYKILNS